MALSCYICIKPGSKWNGSSVPLCAECLRNFSIQPLVSTQTIDKLKAYASEQRKAKETVLLQQISAEHARYYALADLKSVIDSGRYPTLAQIVEKMEDARLKHSELQAELRKLTGMGQMG